MDEKTSQPKPALILLDIYDTILDMTNIERRINYLLNSKRGYILWYELLMQYTFAGNCFHQFHKFSSIAEATLQMTSRLLDREIGTDQVNEILDLMKHLPVHEGVQEGLSALSDQNYRIAALTNSPQTVVNDRMQRTGLISFFEMVLSAEQVQRYKPSLEVYAWAAEQLMLQPSEVLLVSAHSWDIAGAGYAGMQTAYIHRKKQLYYPLATKPLFTCKNLQELADALSNRDD